MASYVEIPAESLLSRLTAAGFSPSLKVSVGEEVYDRWHEKDRRYVVRVYTSIPRGRDAVRKVGQDAIRVCAVFYRDIHVNPHGAIGVGIFKSARVYRSGTVDSVLDRVIERAREAYSFCNEHRKQGASSGHGYRS